MTREKHNFSFRCCKGQIRSIHNTVEIWEYNLFITILHSDDVHFHSRHHDPSENAFAVISIRHPSKDLRSLVAYDQLLRVTQPPLKKKKNSCPDSR